MKNVNAELCNEIHLEICGNFSFAHRTLLCASLCTSASSRPKLVSVLFFIKFVNSWSCPSVLMARFRLLMISVTDPYLGIKKSYVMKPLKISFLKCYTLI